MKLQGSSIWHNRVLEVTREGLRKQRRSLKAERLRNVESNGVTARRGRAVETADQKEHRLSKPRKKEKAWRAARAAAEVVL